MSTLLPLNPWQYWLAIRELAHENIRANVWNNFGWSIMTGVASLLTEAVRDNEFDLQSAVTAISLTAIVWLLFTCGHYVAAPWYLDQKRAQVLNSLQLANEVHQKELEELRTNLPILDVVIEEAHFAPKFSLTHIAVKVDVHNRSDIETKLRGEYELLVRIGDDWRKAVIDNAVLQHYRVDTVVFTGEFDAQGDEDAKTIAQEPLTSLITVSTLKRGNPQNGWLGFTLHNIKWPTRTIGLGYVEPIWFDEEGNEQGGSEEATEEVPILDSIKEVKLVLHDAFREAHHGNKSKPLCQPNRQFRRI